jgi:DNA-binding phage protein
MVKRDKSDEVNLMQSLQDPEEAAACIDTVRELKDKAALLLAHRWVAKAHVMAEVADNAALGEKTPFKSLGNDGSPMRAALLR